MNAVPRSWLAAMIGSAFVLILASGALAAPAHQSTPLIQTASDPKLGTILVNSQGFTLYTLSSEAGGKIQANSTVSAQYVVA